MQAVHYSRVFSAIGARKDPVQAVQQPEPGTFISQLLSKAESPEQKEMATDFANHIVQALINLSSQNTDQFFTIHGHEGVQIHYRLSDDDKYVQLYQLDYVIPWYAGTDTTASIQADGNTHNSADCAERYIQVYSANKDELIDAIQCAITEMAECDLDSYVLRQGLVTNFIVKQHVLRNIFHFFPSQDSNKSDQITEGDIAVAICVLKNVNEFTRDQWFAILHFVLNHHKIISQSKAYGREELLRIAEDHVFGNLDQFLQTNPELVKSAALSIFSPNKLAGLSRMNISAKYVFDNLQIFSKHPKVVASVSSQIMRHSDSFSDEMILLAMTEVAPYLSKKVLPAHSSISNLTWHVIQKSHSDTPNKDQLIQSLGSFFTAVKIQVLNLEGREMELKDMRALTKVLNDYHQLTSLNLSQNQLGDKGVGPLVKLLGENTNPVKLSLSQNKIGERGAESLAGLIKKNVLLTLDISKNNFGYNGSFYIAQGLSECQTLTELNLASNNMADESLGLILNEGLRDGKITHLDLSDNLITPEGAKKIAQFIKNNPFLKELKLGKNKIGDHGLAPILDALKKNDTLTRLDLSDNGITPKGMESMATLIKQQNISLKKLVLSGNTSDPHSGIDLLRAHQKNRHLLEFEFDCELDIDTDDYEIARPYYRGSVLPKLRDYVEQKSAEYQQQKDLIPQAMQSLSMVSRFNIPCTTGPAVESPTQGFPEDLCQKILTIMFDLAIDLKPLTKV